MAGVDESVVDESGEGVHDHPGAELGCPVGKVVRRSDLDPSADAKLDEVVGGTFGSLVA